MRQDKHWHELTPASFDFPMSWTFHRFVSERYGKGDPGPLEPRPLVERVIELRPTVSDDQRIIQLQGNLTSLRDTLKEHVNQGKPKAKDINRGIAE